MRYILLTTTALFCFNGCCSKSVVCQNKELPKQELWVSTQIVPKRVKIDKPVAIESVMKYPQKERRKYIAIKTKQLKGASTVTQKLRNALEEAKEGLDYYSYQAKEMNKLLGYK